MVLEWDPEIGAGTRESGEWPNIGRNYDALFTRDDISRVLHQNGYPGPVG